MCSLKPGVEKHIDRYSALFSATSWVTACHSMSQHHNCPGSKSTGRLAGSTWLWLKDAKSMLKIAQILRSPATISSFATCLQSVSLCLHPIHSHPVKEKKAAINPIQSSFWVKSPFSSIFLYFPMLQPENNQVITGLCMLFSNRCSWRFNWDFSSTRSGPEWPGSTAQ